MAICRSCGEENPDHARFCLACAAPLATGPAPRGERPGELGVSVQLLGVTGEPSTRDHPAGFTAESNAAAPEALHATLKPYHTRVRDEIEQLGGVVEKYVGDAVMAVFGAPVAH